MATITIDEQLQSSDLQKFILVCVFWLFIIIISLLSIHLYYKIGLLLILFISLLVAQWQKSHLLAISCLENSQFGLEWQLQFVQGYLSVPYGETTDVWQATLDNVVDMRQVMVLTFVVFEPLHTTLTLHIWKDQVGDDAWRQLKILAR